MTPSSPFFVGVIALFAGLIASRILSEKAMKLLSPDEKLALLDAFSRLRAFGSIPLVIVALSFFGLPYLPGARTISGFFGLNALLLAYFAVVHVMVMRRMRRLGISAKFQRAHSFARFTAYAGFIVFFVLLGITLVQQA